MLCIADDSGAIGLGGIMGGDSTKAELDTRDIFLEPAFFFPDAIAGRARRYNFSSDASHRFERGVDFDNNVAGIEYAGLTVAAAAATAFKILPGEALALDCRDASGICIAFSAAGKTARILGN